MAYGQTGAGKTYTTLGSGDFQSRGLCARAISFCFDEMGRRNDVTYSVRISTIEIYNESMFDLLSFGKEQEEGKQVGGMSIYEGSDGKSVIKGLTMKVVTSSEEALNALFESQTNRAIAEHQLNDASSRSHFVFTLHFVMRGSGNEGSVVNSKLNIVDLAGSERLEKIMATETVQKEVSSSYDSTQHASY